MSSPVPTQGAGASAQRPESEHSRYIPLTFTQVTQLCRDQLPPAQHMLFDQFSRLLSAWYHYQFHAKSQALQASFANRDPDFGTLLHEVVEHANFERITDDDLNRALAEESTFRLRLQVDFSAFSDIVFYRRGPEVKKARIPTWFGLRRRTIEFTNYEHVLVYVRFREQDGMPAELPGGTLLKLFQNVPKADLEMLFPNTKIAMRLTDKLMIGVPAFVSGVAVFTTKVGGTLLILGGIIGFWLGFHGDPVTLDQSALAALLTASVALGGYLWKQYSNFRSRKIRFMQKLTESLYFKSVADNEGVITYLIDRAEESESKEALLAYTSILSKQRSSMEEIRHDVENMLGDTTHFDIGDALTKLETLDLIQRTADAGETRFSACSLASAFERLDQQWDDLFRA